MLLFAPKVCASTTTERLHGFQGDYRIEGKDAQYKGIKQLIHDSELLAYMEDEIDAGEAYGIYENTLRGWSDLRRQWREASKKPEFNDPADLRRELDRLRREQLGNTSSRDDR